MADSMNATLSDPAFENQETLNAPVSNSEQLHNADTVINEDKTQVKQEKSAVDPEFMEVPKKELINVKEAAENVKEVAGNVKEAAGKFAAKKCSGNEKTASYQFFAQSTKLFNVFWPCYSYFDDYEYICIWTKTRGKRKNTRIKQKEQRVCAYL